MLSLPLSPSVSISIIYFPLPPSFLLYSIHISLLALPQTSHNHSYLSLYLSPFSTPAHSSGTFCSNVTTSKRLSSLDYCSIIIPHCHAPFPYPVLFSFLAIISSLNFHHFLLFPSLNKKCGLIFLPYY